MTLVEVLLGTFALTSTASFALLVYNQLRPQKLEMVDMEVALDDDGISLREFTVLHASHLVCTKHERPAILRAYQGTVHGLVRECLDHDVQFHGAASSIR